MGKGKNFAIGLSGVLIGGMLLSGGVALADTSGSTTVASLTGKIPWVGKMLGHGGGFLGDRGGMFGGRGGMMGEKGWFGAAGAGLSQANLEQLVKEGTITQAKADEIQAYIDKTQKEKQAQLEQMKNMTPEERKALLGKKNTGDSVKLKGPQDLLTALVENSILTQAEADAVKAKLNELAQAQSRQKISDSLKTLVDKGTITQEQSDKILQSFAEAPAKREALAQKIENMTVKEARQYMLDNKGIPQNPLGQLVADGVITQAQADAFQAAMVETAQKENQQRAADGLKALVDKGTITQDQADKILAKLASVKTDQEALREKLKSMTKEELQQYMKDNQVKREDPISQLVTDGTITQDQANALRGIAGLGGKGGPGGKGGKGGPMARGDGWRM